MEDCTACKAQGVDAHVPRWKAPLLFIGVLLFCPCHLPATFGILAAVGASVGGAAWFFGNKPLVYGSFSLLYLVFMIWLIRSIFQHRTAEKERETLHATHEGSA